MNKCVPVLYYVPVNSWKSLGLGSVGSHSRSSYGGVEPCQQRKLTVPVGRVRKIHSSDRGGGGVHNVTPV